MVLDFPVAAAHLLAASGPVTTFGEGLATSAGAGAFLGGFVAGAIGLLVGRKETWRDRAAVNGSYIGGTTMIAAQVGETILE